MALTGVLLSFLIKTCSSTYSPFDIDMGGPTRGGNIMIGRDCPDSAFPLVGSNPKDARRNVTQVRGGITSGSAFFDCFRPV